MFMGRRASIVAAGAMLAGCGMFGGSESDEDNDPRNLTGNSNFYQTAEISSESLLFRRTTDSSTYEVFVKRGRIDPVSFDQVARQDTELAMRQVCGVPLAYVSAPIPRGDDARVLLVKCGAAAPAGEDNSKLHVGDPIHSKND